MLEYLAKSHSLPAGLPFYKLSNGRAFKFFLGQIEPEPREGEGISGDHTAIKLQI